MFLAQFGYYQSEMQRYVAVDVSDGIIKDIKVLDEVVETPDTIFLNGILTISLLFQLLIICWNC